MLDRLDRIEDDVDVQVVLLKGILHELQIINQVTGLSVRPGVPSTRIQGEVMAKATVSIKKRSAAAGVKKTRANKGDAVAAFVFMDNQDDTISVFGTNAAGDQIDISAVATLAVTSDDPTTLTVDAPVGQTVKVHGVKVGSANLTFVDTWTDGSIGPFTFVLPCTLTAGGPTGITVVPGTPVTR